MAIPKKLLKEDGSPFFPITTGEAVVFSDETTAEVSKSEMNKIFNWCDNYIAFYSTDETDNCIKIAESVESYLNNEYYEYFCEV